MHASEWGEGMKNKWESKPIRKRAQILLQERVTMLDRLEFQTDDRYSNPNVNSTLPYEMF
jgi:uncharacterized lipoprotein YbaY